MSNYKYDKEFEEINTPPHSIEAEQAILGILLQDNSTWDNIADSITAEDFYNYEHREIFSQISTLIEYAKPADVLTVSERLTQKQNQGGIAYLNNLVQNMPFAANIKQYADIIRNKSILRSLIGASNEIATLAFNASHEKVKQVLDEAEAKIFAINENQGRTQQGFLNIKGLLSQAVNRIDELVNKQGDSDITGIPSGFVDLDKMTSGLHEGDLVIVAGRPSMGKTTFALNVAEHIAFENDAPVAVFSMEMSAIQLIMRTIGSVGSINQQNLRTGKLAPDEWQNLLMTANKLKDKALYIDETPALSPMELRARARRLARQHGQLGCIVIDYIQLMSANGGSKGENRATEISEISRSLKTLAKELKCPVIALSQLNRGLEQRPNKRPIMSDLRESGAIEQDADVILFIYRDEVYHPDSQDKGTAEIIISKQRNGPIGTIRLSFQGKYTRFVNHVHNYNEYDD
ncbi:MAG: replicative helicase protein [Pseudomonadota bacterium]|jgi:replicative DNA helicase